MKAIFMIGEQRSGSNLLRLMLEQHPRITAPHPPHILQRIMPLLPVYGDLDDDAAFRQLIADVCELIHRNPVPWDDVELDEQEVFSRCRERSLVAVYGATMDLYAEKEGADHWICKSMQNIRWLDDLERYFDDPVYIYLYRDPRDVCLSFTKAVVGEKHPYFIAQKWSELQRLCLDAKERIGSARFCSVSYEALVTDSDAELGRLMSFLGLDYQEKQKEFYHSRAASEAAHASKLWENVEKPVMSSRIGRFRKGLSHDQIHVVESVAGKTMAELGYDPVVTSGSEPLSFTAELVDGYDRLNKELKQVVLKSCEPEDLARRSFQQSLLEEIAGR
ncbi:sulfotransferase [Pontiellaceae bacterium B12227]|nr:sulfotransferase [Pontiellaceae bacterium B12227]